MTEHAHMHDDEAALYAFLALQRVSLPQARELIADINNRVPSVFREEPLVHLMDAGWELEDEIRWDRERYEQTCELVRLARQVGPAISLQILHLIGSGEGDDEEEDPLADKVHLLQDLERLRPGSVLNQSTNGGDDAKNVMWDCGGQVDRRTFLD